MPLPKNKNEFIDFFINNILTVLNVDFEVIKGSKEPVPEEIKKKKVAGQAELDVRIIRQRKKIEDENNKLNKLIDKDVTLERWKELLWQTGKPLENIVKDFFKVLGLELKSEEIDLVGEYNEKEVFIEVKGNLNCINHEKDFRQILERKTNSENFENNISMLVGNAFRLKPLNERPPTKNHSLFAKTCIPVAEANKIGLISTIELYNIINDILGHEKKVNKKKVLDEILNCKGIYKY